MRYNEDRRTIPKYQRKVVVMVIPERVVNVKFDDDETVALIVHEKAPDITFIVRWNADRTAFIVSSNQDGIVFDIKTFEARDHSFEDLVAQLSEITDWIYKIWLSPLIAGGTN